MNRPILLNRRFTAALAATEAQFDVAPSALLGRSRMPRIVAARHACMAALYHTCDTSYTELGERFGKDHSSVMYGVARAREIARSNPNYKAQLVAIAVAVSRCE